MLKQLADYARTREIVIDPGFKPKAVRWAIVFDSKDGFTGFVPLGQTDAKKNLGRTFNKCPEMDPTAMQGNIRRSHFLVETADVVALYGDKTNDEKTQAKHKYFVYLLEEAGKTMPQLAIIAKWLKEERTVRDIQKAMAESKIRSNDKVTFQIDGEFPVEQDYWHEWWRKCRQILKGEPVKEIESNLMRCFVTGELIAPLKTHPKIEGLAGIGGQPSGDALIGFDKEAYRSYGLKQSLNAAVSEEGASAYRAGLNDLIKNNSQRLVNTRVVHWFKKKVKPQDDLLEWLIEPQEVEELNARYKAKELLESIKTGKRPDLGGNYYYVLTLSGAAGRVMVRDWIEGQFEELVKNITQWFDDLEIVQWDGSLPKQSPRFLATLGSLVTRKLDELPALVIAKMWRVAVRGESVPYSFLAQSLVRRKMEILQPDEKPINSTGMALIKAYHLRKYRKEGNTLSEMLKPVLNEDFPNPTYQCGRLMAVLAELQRAALGDVGTGVVQRYYAAASTTPALVLGRLTHASQFHLNKLEAGLAHWYESKIAGIWSRLNEAPPRTLSLEEQSLFAMGYYQQLADMRTKKSDSLNKEEKR